LNGSLLVAIIVACVCSTYIELGILEEASAELKTKAITCEDDGPCRVQLSNSSGTFTVEGPANKTASMTPLESTLFDYEMELFDREMD
jgi:hypothetical protein